MFKTSWDDPINEASARSLANQLLTYSCNGDQGRPEKDDDVYDAITENRDSGGSYSSCGDLGHWLLYRLGVRLDMVNRKEHKGWKMGLNVSKLAWCPYAKAPTKDNTFACGDIIIIWSQPTGTDAHVMCVLEDRGEGSDREIVTANYGQPGGKILTSKVAYSKFGNTSKMVLGHRTIQRWIPLINVLSAAQKTKKLEDAEDVTRSENGDIIWTPGV